MTPDPPKIENNKFVLKCILGHLQCFEHLFFLVENRPIPPPLLVENYTFFFKLPLPICLTFNGQKKSTVEIRRWGKVEITFFNRIFEAPAQTMPIQISLHTTSSILLAFSNKGRGLLHLFLSKLGSLLCLFLPSKILLVLPIPD